MQVVSNYLEEKSAHRSYFLGVGRTDLPVVCFILSFVSFFYKRLVKRMILGSAHKPHVDVRQLGKRLVQRPLC